MNATGKRVSSPLAAAPNGRMPVPEWARRLGVLLDSAIRIPGTNLRIGLDPILGALLPELGDAISAVLSLSLFLVAFQQRAPKAVMGRMLVNVGLDAILGAIPGVGDVFDFAFKANERNLALLERHRQDPTRAATVGDWAVLVGVGLAALVFVTLPIVLGFALVRWLTRVAPLGGS